MEKMKLPCIDSDFFFIKQIPFIKASLTVCIMYLRSLIPYTILVNAFCL